MQCEHGHMISARPVLPSSAAFRFRMPIGGSAERAISMFGSAFLVVRSGGSAEHAISIFGSAFLVVRSAQ